YTRNSYPSLVSGQFKCKGLRSLRVFFCFNFSHTPTNIIEPKKLVISSEDDKLFSFRDLGATFRKLRPTQIKKNRQYIPGPSSFIQIT
ncbi:hypothetical protein, partial [Scopulibacillus cellulosilyticus]